MLKKEGDYHCCIGRLSGAVINYFLDGGSPPTKLLRLGIQMRMEFDMTSPCFAHNAVVNRPNSDRRIKNSLP